MALSEAQLAYAAGIVDGEGCISVTFRRTSPTVRVHVTNTDARLVNLLREWFGGYVWTEQRPRAGHKVRYSWEVAALQAAAVLEAILPFLVVKREQAELALAVKATAGRRGARASIGVVQQREALAARLRVLTRKGVA